MIIDLINCAVDLKLPWLYLGYYVEQSQKMRIKPAFSRQKFSVTVAGRYLGIMMTDKYGSPRIFIRTPYDCIF